MMPKAVNMSYLQDISRLWKIYNAGVTSVHPQEIVKNFVRREGEKLVIGNEKYDLRHNVYAVGFGKAVVGMVRPIENALRISDSTSHLQKAILSVPVGIKKQLSLDDATDTSANNNIVEYLEGAKDNIPDEAAFMASKRIVSLVKSLKEQDILLVLISGGGSALLPYPEPPLTLDEKLSIIKSLSRAGADIFELNTVRKALSGTKGGQLAQMTRARTISLILSDVIGSPLDVIASGPTVNNTDPPEAATQVLKKYNVPITDNMQQVLKAKTEPEGIEVSHSHVTNHIIGSLEIALSAVQRFIDEQANDNHHSLALILSSSLQGEAGKVGKSVAELAAAVSHMLNQDTKQEHEDNSNMLSQDLLQGLCIEPGKETTLRDAAAECRKLKSPLWLVFGGETTVTVKGSGKGGRNQEMVLAASISLQKTMRGSPFRGEVFFLSGGTDGIDGPTDAAGALTYWTPDRSQVTEALEQNLSPEAFLSNNDSYSYFSSLSSGKYHLTPGHTGTNVMDIQILLINPAY